MQLFWKTLVIVENHENMKMLYETQTQQNEDKLTRLSSSGLTEKYALSAFACKHKQLTNSA